MPQVLAHVALVVREYDEAISFFVEKLGFELIEDTYQPEQDKRWVVVAPSGSNGCSILLARASNDHQAQWIGAQAGGRVFLFLRTDDYGGTIACFWIVASTLRVSRRKHLMDGSRFSKTFTAISGTLWSLQTAGRKSIIRRSRLLLAQ